MASVFKRKRDRLRKNSAWFIAFSDENGVRRTVKGCSVKQATQLMAAKLESEAELRRRGVIDRKADLYRLHEATPLADHLEAWRIYLLGKGNGDRHAIEGHARVVNLIALAKATRLSDLTLTRVQAALATLKDKGRSLRTIHHYASLAKNFAKWAWHDGRSRDDLLAHLQLPDNPESDRRRKRRALSEGELLRLVAAAETGPTYSGLPGVDRSMLYRIAAGTGFRSDELQSLTPESFDLEGEFPTITVEAKDSKRRRRDVQPIQSSLASILKPWLAGRREGQQVFPVDRWAILEALKADLKAADIQYKTDEGFADVHSLRHAYITALAKSNAPVKIVQSLARHSTPVLTLGVYTHLALYDQTPALDSLPDLTRTGPDSEPGALAVTGTDSGSPDSHNRAAHWQRARDASGRNQSSPDVIAKSTVQSSMYVSPLKESGSDAYSRIATPIDDAGSVSVAGARPGLQIRTWPGRVNNFAFRRDGLEWHSSTTIQSPPLAGFLTRSQSVFAGRSRYRNHRWTLSGAPTGRHSRRQPLTRR
jgi:integrase